MFPISSIKISRQPAADCYYILTSLSPPSLLSPRLASLEISQYLFSKRSSKLSVGTMIVGFEKGQPRIYEVDDSGYRGKCLYCSIGKAKINIFNITAINSPKPTNTNNNAIA
jgi:hypothetical protein